MIDLRFGNCFDIMLTIPDNTIDCIVTDHPYEFVSKNPRGGGFMRKENKRHLEQINDSFGMSFDPTIFLSEAKRLCKRFNL